MAEPRIRRAPAGGRWAWALVITASAITAVAAVYGLVLPPVRTVAVFWFLLVCPGMAFVGLLRVRERLLEWTLAVALSLALGVVVAQVMLFTGGWTASGGVVALALLALLGVALQVSPVGRR